MTNARTWHVATPSVKLFGSWVAERKV
jgi:hypothetical protein